MNDDLKYLDKFMLMNQDWCEKISDNKKENDVQIFSTMEMIEYCLKNNVRLKSFSSIPELNDEYNEYLVFDGEGRLTSDITKDMLDKKFAIKVNNNNSSNILDRKFKKGSIWVESYTGKVMSPFNTLRETFEYLSEVGIISFIEKISHRDNYSNVKILATRISK